MASYFHVLQKGRTCAVAKIKTIEWKLSGIGWWIKRRHHDRVPCPCAQHNRTPLDILRLVQFVTQLLLVIFVQKFIQLLFINLHLTYRTHWTVSNVDNAVVRRSNLSDTVPSGTSSRQTDCRSVNVPCTKQRIIFSILRSLFLICRISRYHVFFSRFFFLSTKNQSRQIVLHHFPNIQQVN